MLDGVERSKLPERIFTFVYKHPNTHNGCPNIGTQQTKSFNVTALHLARILAANTPVICENPACGADYQLQK